jgi:hypothetical protein
LAKNSTVDRIPLSVPKTANCGSWRCGNAFGVRRGGMTWTEVISSPSSQRVVSTSWIIESVIVMKLVYASPTVAFRWTLWTISGTPIAPSSRARLTSR